MANPNRAGMSHNAWRLFRTPSAEQEQNRIQRSVTRNQELNAIMDAVSCGALTPEEGAEKVRELNKQNR